MPKQLFANNAKAKLNASILNTDLTLTVQAGQGALFPSPTNGRYFRFTLVDASGNIEVCECTARTGDTLAPITRGLEGTTPRAFSSGDKCELRWTKGGAERCEQTAGLEVLAVNTTLDAGDINDLKIITATATMSLPPSAVAAVGDWIEFKSITTGNVQLAPDGTDTLDGLNANYQLPSYCVCRIMKTAAGQWTLVKRPEAHVGQTIISGASATPLGAIPKDASAVSRATYAGLFAAIGTDFGVGDGVTTFNVPDPQGRAIVGAGAGAGLTARTKADKFGAETHTLTKAETPLKDHVHTGGRDGAAAGAGPGWGGTVTGVLSSLVDTGSTGDATAAAHSIQSPGLAMKMYIKT